MSVQSNVKNRVELLSDFHRASIEKGHKCECQGRLVLTRKLGVDEFYKCVGCGAIHSYSSYTGLWSMVSNKPESIATRNRARGLRNREQVIGQ